MSDNVLQSVLDPSEMAGAVVGGRLQAFEQIGYALFEMGECRGAVVADRYPVEAVGQRPHRDLELLGAFAGRWPLAAFQRRGQGGDALLENRERIAVVSRTGKLIDPGRHCTDVVAEPRQCVV